MTTQAIVRDSQTGNSQTPDTTVQRDFNPPLSSLLSMTEDAVDSMLRRHAILVSFKDQILKQGRDYGTIPGTNDKLVLFKSGAEKFCSCFSLTPNLTIIQKVEDWTGEEHNGEPFFYYHYRCGLYHKGHLVAEADGSCNSWESKYRYRKGERTCPQCGSASIKKSRQEDGWYCWAKIGGCGAQFSGNDPSIIRQETGRVPNPDIFDQVNTVQKMAIKRAFIAATLIAVNASDFFTHEEDAGADSDVVANGVVDGEVVDGRGPRQSTTNRSRNGSNQAQSQTQQGRPGPDLPAIRTGRFRELVSEAQSNNWAVEDGRFNQFRLLNAIRNGGFRHPAIDNNTVDEAAECMRRHYGAKASSTQPAAPPQGQGNDQDNMPSSAVISTTEYDEFCRECNGRGLDFDSFEAREQFAEAWAEWSGEFADIPSMTAENFALATQAIREGMVWGY